MQRPGNRLMHASGIVLGIVLVVTGAPALAIEEPQYELVARYPEFELRRYAPYLIAETAVRGSFDQVGGIAFRILADYIFGNNRQNQRVEMTAPVTQRRAAAGGEKIEMTAPVQQRAAEPGGEPGRYLVSFVMPQRFRLETLPEPLDPRVTVREEPGRLMAVRRYSGRWTQENYRRNLATLREAIAQAGLTVSGDPVYARYNSPFSLWFLRRNEVMIEVREPS